MSTLKYLEKLRDQHMVYIEIDKVIELLKGE
jgi:hypothetical protein